MGELPNIGELGNADEPPETRYTAFEIWDYHQLIYPSTGLQTWIDLADSFYRAAEVIIDNVVDGRCLQDVEGIAAIFLFRHYLELSLKGIVGSGRWLVGPDVNATPDQVKAVGREHRLSILWEWVLRDAKPKLKQYWIGYDVAFVERCIAEFDQADQKSFAWRYPGQGSEKYSYDFSRLRLAIRHVRHVLEGIRCCLIEMYGQNADWENELRSM